MNQTGQHMHTLFAGFDGEHLKTFSLEVDCCTVLEALSALEKAIHDIRLRQLHFGYTSNSSVRTGMKLLNNSLKN